MKNKHENNDGKNNNNNNNNHFLQRNFIERFTINIQSFLMKSLEYCARLFTSNYCCIKAHEPGKFQVRKTAPELSEN